MAYGQAMLGETVELYKDAVEWGKAKNTLKAAVGCRKTVR